MSYEPRPINTEEVALSDEVRQLTEELTHAGGARATRQGEELSPSSLPG